jgi:predicted small secreted protein
VCLCIRTHFHVFNVRACALVHVWLCTCWLCVELVQASSSSATLGAAGLLAQARALRTQWDAVELAAALVAAQNTVDGVGRELAAARAAAAAAAADGAAAQRRISELEAALKHSR